MPEVITKYPDIVMQVLKSAGFQCGVGAKQSILKACPKEAFCTTPGGEICVYGVNDVAHMTQITRSDIISGFENKGNLFHQTDIILCSAVFIIGIFIGYLIKALMK